ncbi:hypothetical protein [Clostridium ljungdahlii]|uniref:hypothetical protein n=1 Tax=Clostridium ljungdahlii TaxID=1538 RepID=UPI00386D1CFD
MENAIYMLQKKLKQSNIEFIFSGTFSQGLIEELGIALKQRMQLQQAKRGRLARLFLLLLNKHKILNNMKYQKKIQKIFWL